MRSSKKSPRVSPSAPSFLEPLEPRLMMSAALDLAVAPLAASLPAVVATPLDSAPGISIDGNGATITPGEDAPGYADNTEFGYMSIAGAGATRKYTITNTGTAPLTLNGRNPVAITGANAKDFILLSRPAATIAAGGSTSFVVKFVPHGSGLRTATFSIANNAGDPYSFTVEGTGLVVNRSRTGLQWATLQQGIASNTGAFAGCDLAVNYTGYLLDGTKFDSSLAPDRSPSDVKLFTIDQSTGHYDASYGFMEGLMGIKMGTLGDMTAGEERILIIPPNIGYGSTGKGPIPANATLIFDVQVVAMGIPQLGVQGTNSQAVTDGAAPSATNGTDFGSLPPGTTSATTTFALGNVSGTGSLWFTNSRSPITLTGPNARDFVLDTSSMSQNGTFSVTFQPHSLGAKTAVVSVYTNDQTTGTPGVFKINLSGDTTRYVDLTASIGRNRLPASTVSGNNTTLVLPVVVHNAGNVPVPGGSLMNVDVYARPDGGDGSTDTLLTTLSDVRVGIGAGRSATYAARISLPMGFASGSYQLVAVVDSTNTITETNDTNNTAVTSNSIAVTRGFNDLTGTINSSRFPASAIAGRTAILVPVLLKNEGTAPIPPTGAISIQVFVRTDDGQGGYTDTVLTTLNNLRIGRLGAGQTRVINVGVRIPASLPAGSYQIGANIDSTNAIAEDNEGNNSALATPVITVSL